MAVIETLYDVLAEIWEFVMDYLPILLGVVAFVIIIAALTAGSDASVEIRCGGGQVVHAKPGDTVVCAAPR